MGAEYVPLVLDAQPGLMVIVVELPEAVTASVYDAGLGLEYGGVEGSFNSFPVTRT